MKVITHKAPRHADDFFALCFLKRFYGDITVEEVAPQDPALEGHKKNREIMLVDVGQDYNPELKNFDHHHDQNLPCALTLITDYLGVRERLEGEFLRGIDYTDRFGPVEGLKKAGIQNTWNEELDRMRKIILLSETTGALADVFMEVCKFPYSKAWEALYVKADDLGLLSVGKSAVEKEEQEFLRKLNQAKVFEINGLKVVYSLESLAPNHSKAFKLFDADLIVERNSMKPEHTSIIKNTAKPNIKEVDLSKVFEVYPKVFIHQTGFIAVIDKLVDQVDVQEIVKTICYK